METKINIAKILKNKPEGTKLWTDMFGSVTLYVVTDACDAFQVKHHNKYPWFDEDGKLYKEGVLCASSKNGHLMTIQGSTDVILMVCQMQKRLSIAS